MERYSQHNIHLDGLQEVKHPANVALYQDYYGMYGNVYATHIVEIEGIDQLIPRDQYKTEEEKEARKKWFRDKVNNSVYENLMFTYDLGSKKDANSFWMRQLEFSNKLIHDVVDLALPSTYKSAYGIRNEVEIREKPADRIHRLLRKYSDYTQQFEHIRQLDLMKIGGDIEYKMMNSEFGTLLHHIQDTLDEKVYTAFPDSNKRNKNYTFQALHNNETNQFMGEYSISSDPSLLASCHVKNHNIQCRYIPGIGRVLTQPRLKEPLVMGIKTLDKGEIEYGGEIDVNRDVYDPMGIMFVALDDIDPKTFHDDRNEMAALVMNSILDVKQYRGRIGVQEDSKNNSNGRTVSSGLSWLRYQLNYPGYKDPAELIFMDLPAYLNYMFNVGDLKDPNIKDRAHKLYQTMRAQRVFRTLFPSNIYNGTDYGHYDIQGAMRQKQQEVAIGLINAQHSVITENEPIIIK